MLTVIKTVSAAHSGLDEVNYNRVSKHRLNGETPKMLTGYKNLTVRAEIQLSLNYFKVVHSVHFISKCTVYYTNEMRSLN